MTRTRPPAVGARGRAHRGRAPARRGTRRGGARARARHAPVRLRRDARGRAGARAAGRARARRPHAARAPRAQGAARARGPRRAARARRRRGRPAPSASTPARRARCCTPSTTGSRRRRSASPAPTSPSATSTCIAPAGVHVNLDLLSQIERYGRRCPGRAVGLRVNPRGGVMRGHAESLYSGARPTKFGIYEEDLDAALAAARRHDLVVDTLHVHLANGMLDDELPAFDAALEPVARMAEALLDAGCPLAEVNVGGGLGTPAARRRAAARPRRLRRHPRAPLRRPRRGRRRRAGRVPHQRVAASSSPRSSPSRSGSATTFVGLDAGWNVMNDAYIYGRRPSAVVAARAGAPRDARRRRSPATSTRATTSSLGMPFPEVERGGDRRLRVASAATARACGPTTACGRAPSALYFTDRV